MTLAVTLANKSLLTREELAAAFAETGRQQLAKGESESRQVAARHLAEFFRLAVIGDDVRSRLRVIPGGRDD